MSNSISQLLEQFLELNTNSLETFNRINEAITTDKETVVIDLFNPNTNKTQTIQIPAFGYLKREIERLNINLNSLSGLEGSNANIRLKDGSIRAVHASRLKGPSPSITSLDSPTTFNTKLNAFFEDFLNPLLVINLDVTGQIPVETEKVYVERYIFDESDLRTVTDFDEIYKGESEIDYSSFKTQLIDNAYVYSIDSEVLNMPMRMIQYAGLFDVIKVENIEKNFIVNGVTSTKTVKLFTVNKLSYTDTDKLLKDTETLKINDSLIVNSGKYRTRYQVISIDSATSQLELLLLEGFESIKVGANQLGIYKDVDTNLNIEIKVGFNERQIIFVKPIDPTSKIPAEYFSPGVSFYSNELEIVNSTGNSMTLAAYYKNEVSDFGQFIKSLKVDYIPPSSVGIVPNPPVITTSNFKVVQVNKHLTDNSNTDKIKQLKSDKISTEQSLKRLDESIKQKKSLINTKKFNSSAEKDVNTNELSSLVLQKETESKLFSSIITEIKSSAESADLQTVSPKYRMRGFWSIPEPKKIGNEVSQEVVQFRIRYRYASTSGKTAIIDQIKFKDETNSTEKTAAFSNWVEVLGPVRKRKLNSLGIYSWIIESEEDADAVNFNSIDVSINPGEVVEFMIKSVSEAGFPANPIESSWSEIYKFEFPQGEVNTDEMASVIKTNEMDALRVQIQQDLDSIGVYSHVAESFKVDDKTYAHSANSVASGFLTSQQNPISVYEKLLELQNEVLSLRAVIEGTLGELLVRIIDESGNVTQVTNNTTVQLFAGYYVNEIPTTGGKGFIVSKNFKIELSNTKATNLELIARIIGDTSKALPVSSSNVIFGLGEGTPEESYSNDSYYTGEAKYDLVPVMYQNVPNIAGSAYDKTYFNIGPSQSTQLKGQFIYSRFKNLANDENLYVINEGDNGDINPDSSGEGYGYGYDSYEYGLSFNYNTVPTISGVSKITNFNSSTITPWPSTVSPDDFIWTGDFDGDQLAKRTSVFNVTNAIYSNGIFMHINHPLLLNGTISAISIISNGMVGMPKTAPLKSTDANGKKQTPLRIIETKNNLNTLGLRSTAITGFSPDDQYLLGGKSCGSFLYVSPLNVDSLIVDADNKRGKKIIPGGKANSVVVDLIFQYRMTDYYGAGDNGTGRIAGVISSIFTNLTYSKKIGIDILDFGGNSFQFDIEVYSKYTTQGKNINNITSSMLSNYNTNFDNSSSSTNSGRRKYLTDNTTNFAYPEIQ
jgi:hypothetical protein